MFRLKAAMVGGLVLVTTAGVADAQARPHAAEQQTKLVTIQVRSTYTEAASQMDGVQCDGWSKWADPQSFHPRCYMLLVGSAEFKGTISGDDWYEVRGWLPEDPNEAGEIVYDGRNWMTQATIKGCGSGTFMYDDDNGTESYKDTDPQTLYSPAHNDWHIEPGSGAGGLSGLVSGSGTIEFQDGQVTMAGLTNDPQASHGTMEGTVTCRVPVNSGGS